MDQWEVSYQDLELFLQVRDKLLENYFNCTFSLPFRDGSKTNNPSEGYNFVFANGTLFISCRPPIYLWFQVVKKELVKVRNIYV